MTNTIKNALLGIFVLISVACEGPSTLPAPYDPPSVSPQAELYGTIGGVSMEGTAQLYETSSGGYEIIYETPTEAAMVFIPSLSASLALECSGPSKHDWVFDQAANIVVEKDVEFEIVTFNTENTYGYFVWAPSDK